MIVGDGWRRIVRRLLVDRVVAVQIAVIRGMPRLEFCVVDAMHVDRIGGKLCRRAMPPRRAADDERQRQKPNKCVPKNAMHRLLQ